MKTRSRSDPCTLMSRFTASKRNEDKNEEGVLASPSKRSRGTPSNDSSPKTLPRTSAKVGGSTATRSTSKAGPSWAIIKRPRTKPKVGPKVRLPRRILTSEDDDTVAKTVAVEQLQQPNSPAVPSEPAMALPATPPRVREEIARPVSPISCMSEDSELDSSDAGDDTTGEIRIYTDVEESFESIRGAGANGAENRAPSPKNENPNQKRRLPTTTAEARENPILLTKTSRRRGVVLPMHARQGPGRCMTHGEMQEVLNYVCNNRLISQVGGNRIWQALADEKIISDRTWHTLRTNFRNTILKKLNTFYIPNKKDYQQLALLSSKLIPTSNGNS